MKSLDTYEPRFTVTAAEPASREAAPSKWWRDRGDQWVLHARIKEKGRRKEPDS